MSVVNKDHTRDAKPCAEKKTTSKDLMNIQPNKINKNLLICSNETKPVSSKQHTYRIPRSSILDRVKQFLPEIEHANNNMVNISPEEKEELDIEKLNDDDAFIQMEVALVDPDLLLSEDDDDDDSDSDCDSVPNCSILMAKNTNIVEQLKEDGK